MGALADIEGVVLSMAEDGVSLFNKSKEWSKRVRE